MRQAVRLAVVVVALGATTIASGATRAAPALSGPFTIKPAEMTLPAGAKPGSFRRTIQPFGAWTLICDEEVKAHRRVCNVLQSIVDPAGQTVFSWSLAANQGGAPVFIVRLPATLAGDHFAQVILGATNPVAAGVILSTCDAATCLGFLPVDARIQRQITAHATVAIKVRVGLSVQTFDATLDGLGQAVASLK